MRTNMVEPPAYLFSSLERKNYSMPPARNPQYHIVFHPISAGVGVGNRGSLAEITVPYPTLEVAILRQDGPPPASGYVAVKIVDDTGKVCRERTIGQHVAAISSMW